MKTTALLSGNPGQESDNHKGLKMENIKLPSVPRDVHSIRSVGCSDGKFITAPQKPAVTPVGMAISSEATVTRAAHENHQEKDLRDCLTPAPSEQMPVLCNPAYYCYSPFPSGESRLRQSMPSAVVPPIANRLLFPFDRQKFQSVWQCAIFAPNFAAAEATHLAGIVDLTLWVKSFQKIPRQTFLPSDSTRGTDEIVNFFHKTDLFSTPFLHAATNYDKGGIATATDVIAKLYQLVDEFRIDRQDPFSKNLESVIGGLENPLFARSTLTEEFHRENIVSVYGPCGSEVEHWMMFSSPIARNYFVPLELLVDSYGRSRFFTISPRKLHLAGLFDAVGELAGQIVITPDIDEFLKNSCNSYGARVVTWIGADLSVEYVDWSPLYNQSVIYIVNPATFGGDARRCLRCMESVCGKLENNGCRITLADADKVDISLNIRKLCMLKFYNFEDRFAIYKKYGVAAPENVVNYDDAFYCPGVVNAADLSLVNGIINRNDISVIFGPSKCGKTRLADSLRYAITRGYDLDHRHTISTPQSVLVLAGEMSKTQQDNRRAVCERMYPKKPKNNTFSELAHLKNKVDTPQGVRELEVLIRHANARHSDKSGIRVVILDNLKTLTEKGESKSGWQKLYDALDKLREKCSLTFVIIHHTNKENESFGTSDLDAKADSTFACVKDVHELAKYDPILSSDHASRRDYLDYLAAQYAQWRLAHPNHTAFFFVGKETRDLKPTDGWPVFMHMLPEDDRPHWVCEEFLNPEHPWSRQSFEGDVVTTPPTLSTVRSNESTAEAHEPPAADKGGEGTKIPTYAKLKGMDRESVIAWLKTAVAAHCQTREAIGQYFGTDKNGIDYLMKKHNLTSADLEKSR